MSLLKHWLHRRRRPLRYAFLKTLLANQRRTRTGALEQQRADLVAMVRFALAHVPYYRGRLAPLEREIRAGDFDLADLPVLCKDDVIGHLDALLADTADRSQAKMGHTGGSTGKPLAFWYDETKHELMRAGMCRSYMGSGWRPGQKILNFWGARQDTVAGGVFGAGWDDFIAAEQTIPAHEFSAVQLHTWARHIQSWQPVLLQGYASILAELARFVDAERLSMPKSLLGVYSTAEVLADWQRELMERAFGCKVFNQYGSREIPNMACECRRGHVHVFTDMVQLESRPEEGEDRLFVSSLTNRLMPMLRYDIGDSGRLVEGDCDCGWPFPLMEMGMCRQNDLIRTADGKGVHPSFFNRLLYGLTQIRQYQFVQEAPDRLCLTLASSTRLTAETELGLRKSIHREVDAAMRFEIAYVDDIPRTVSGKHRFVIGCQVARDGS